MRPHQRDTIHHIKEIQYTTSKRYNTIHQRDTTQYTTSKRYNTPHQRDTIRHIKEIQYTTSKRYNTPHQRNPPPSICERNLRAEISAYEQPPRKNTSTMRGRSTVGRSGGNKERQDEGEVIIIVRETVAYIRLFS